MHIRSKTKNHITFRCSYHELDLLNDIINYGTEAFISKYENGDFDFKGKGYKTSANKFCAGWNIIPDEYINREAE